MTKQNEFNQAILKDDIELAALLLKDSSVDPASDNNWAIIDAHTNLRWTRGKYITYVKKTLDFLWNEKRVKDSLKNDNIELYNILIKKDIKNKIGKF
jgi:hypothetical protein